MKKGIVVLLAVVLLVGLMAACSRPAAKHQPDNDQGGTTDPNNQTSAPNNETKPNLDNWGVLDTKTVRNENGLKEVVFRWPIVSGRTDYTGSVALQNDGTVVLIDSYASGYSPVVDSVDQVFPAYFEQTAKVFGSYYRSAYSDGEFTIEETETVTIGEYEFLKYHGKHNYKYDGNSRSKQYVIYLTTTKLNNAYFYFLVSDVTEDQSAGAIMEDHAYKMALSIYEQD